MTWSSKIIECSKILGLGQRLPSALQGQIFHVGFRCVQCHYFIMFKLQKNSLLVFWSLSQHLIGW